MSKAIKILFFGMIAIAFNSLVSCSLLRQPERIIETQTVYKETVRDSIVTIPADSSAITALFECDSLNRVILKQLEQKQGTRSSIEVKTSYMPSGNLMLSADCKCDSINIYLTIKDRFVSQKFKQKETVVIKPQAKKSRFWLGFSLAIILVLVIVIVRKVIIFKTDKIISTWTK